MRNVAVLLTFTRQDLIDRYSGSVLGGAWSLLMPLVNILIFTLVFSEIMGARLSMAGMQQSEYNYSLYLVSAMLAWNCFSATVTRTTTIFQDKAGIIAKVSISLRTLPLYLLLSESTIYVISMVFFLGFIVLIDFPLSWSLLALPVVFVIQQVIAYGLGLIFATFSVFLRDIRELVDIVFKVWFWLTPIVYVTDIIPDHWAGVLAYNPVTPFVDAYRDMVLLHQLPSLQFLVVTTTVAGVTLALALFITQRLQQDIRDFI